MRKRPGAPGSVYSACSPQGERPNHVSRHFGRVPQAASCFCVGINALCGFVTCVRLDTSLTPHVRIRMHRATQSAS